MAPANAATTSIRSTTQYAKLKAYVSLLETKSGQPQTQAQISEYRVTLKQKKADASIKVRILYQKDLAQAQDKRATQKAKIAKLKKQKKTQLAQLKQAKVAALNAIAADRRADLAKIENEYDSKILKSQKRLKKLNTKLNKATDPVKRQTLRDEIDAVQSQLNTLQRARTSEIKATTEIYNNKQEAATEKWDNKIEQADTRFSEQIAQLQEQSREQYQENKQAAQQRRAQNFADVKTQYSRGVEFINKMVNSEQPA